LKLSEKFLNVADEHLTRDGSDSLVIHSYWPGGRPAGQNSRGLLRLLLLLRALSPLIIDQYSSTRLLITTKLAGSVGAEMTAETVGHMKPKL